MFELLHSEALGYIFYKHLQAFQSKRIKGTVKSRFCGHTTINFLKIFSEH